MSVPPTTSSGPVALLERPARIPGNSHTEWTKAWGPRTQCFAGRKRYELHHVHPRSRGGAAYDLDNIVIVTPRHHAEVLGKSYHYGGGGR